MGEHDKGPGKMRRLRPTRDRSKWAAQEMKGIQTRDTCTPPEPCMIAHEREPEPVRAPAQSYLEKCVLAHNFLLGCSC